MESCEVCGFEGSSRSDLSLYLNVIGDVYLVLRFHFRHFARTRLDHDAVGAYIIDNLDRRDKIRRFGWIRRKIEYCERVDGQRSLYRGDVLAVLLGDDGAKNVPDSAKKDGHEIVSVEREGNHWRVIIRN